MSTLPEKLSPLLAILSLIFITGAASANSPLTIAAANYPLKFFAEQIAGNQAKVAFPMPADIDPAFWQPNAEDIAALQKADLVLLNGAHYSKWLPKVSLSLFKQVNTSAVFRDQYIHQTSGVTHNHGEGGEHSHGETAFTTWLDFSLANLQAKSIYNALVKKRPASRQRFLIKLEKLQSRLSEFDHQLLELGKILNNAPLIGSHPVYQYLKNRYQLNLTSVHWEPEEAPNQQQWQAFQQLLEKHPSKWMIWEGQPAKETVEKLQSLGVSSIVFSPAGNIPDQGDFFSVMENNIQQLRSINPNP